MLPKRSLGQPKGSKSWSVGEKWGAMDPPPLLENWDKQSGDSIYHLCGDNHLTFFFNTIQYIGHISHNLKPV